MQSFFINSDHAHYLSDVCQFLTKNVNPPLTSGHQPQLYRQAQMWVLDPVSLYKSLFLTAQLVLIDY
jgi:hypothetical protein